MSTIAITANIGLNYADPTTFKNEIQSPIDSLKSGDEVEFSGMFDIGPNTIKIKKPIKIKGVPGASGMKPKIIGTSGSRMKDGITMMKALFVKGKPATTPNMDCGVISILTEDTVEISNLLLEHFPLDATGNPNNDPHGSQTIAYFVDNLKESSFIVRDCEIDTSATVAINTESLNAHTIDPVKHDFIIHGCAFKGRNPPKAGPRRGSTFDPGLRWLAGNWLSIKLGQHFDASTEQAQINDPNLQRPVDIRDSYFEVSDCSMEVAQCAAVAVWGCRSNANSKLVISNNTMGYPVNLADAPNKNLFDPSDAMIPQALGRMGLAYGVLFCYLGQQFHLPNGTALICDNDIRVEGYFVNDAAGIRVDCRNTDSQNSVRTVVSNNKITFAVPSLPAPPSDSLSCIAYNDLEPSGSLNASTVITRNELFMGPVGPRCGIFAGGTAHDMIIEGNDFTKLTALEADIYLNGYKCFVSENSFMDPQSKKLPANFHSVTLGAGSADNVAVFGAHDFKPVPNPSLWPAGYQAKCLNNLGSNNKWIPL